MHAMPAAPAATQDEGHLQLKRLIDALAATRTNLEWQLQRYEQAQSPAERGDVLHDAIIAVEDRLSPQSRLGAIAKTRDAFHAIAGRHRR